MVDSDAPIAPAASPPPDTLGQTLRNARLMQDLTLEQLAADLRIEAKHLNALEENRFERIGVPVFIKGYLKQYGQRLGLDVRDLLALYYKQTTLSDVQIQPSRTIKLRDDRQITSWILAVVVLLAVIAGLVWWWSGGSAILRPTSTAPPAETGTAPAVAEPAAEPAPPSRALPLPLEDSSPSEPPAAESAPGEAAAAPAPAAAAAVAADEADDDERAAPIVAIPLELTFDRESWVEITDARGERLLFGLNAAGRQVTVRGEPPIAVVLGDADGVRLTVAGEPYAIPTTGREGNLARFSVDIAEE